MVGCEKRSPRIHVGFPHGCNGQICVSTILLKRDKFLKKSNKTPKNEIEKAEKLRKQYIVTEDSVEYAKLSSWALLRNQSKYSYVFIFLSELQIYFLRCSSFVIIFVEALIFELIVCQVSFFQNCASFLVVFENEGVFS